MNRAMITSAVTMGQLQQKLNTIAHDLANLNTPGYKGRTVQFSSLLFQQRANLPVAENGAGRVTPNGIRQGNGAGAAQTSLEMDQGTIRETGRPLDLALTVKDAFFQIGLESGETAYTRAGQFYLTPVEGEPDLLQLVDADGFGVLGTEGAIYVPAAYEEMTFMPDGTVTVTMPGGATEAVGRLALVQIERPDLLLARGHNRYVLPDAVAAEEVTLPLAEGVDAVRQGALESSNVRLAEEMVQMLNVQRAYEMNARAFSLADQAYGLVNNIR